MRLTSFFKQLTLYCLPLMAVCGGVSACEEEAVQPDSGFVLYYPAISQIAPSTNITVSPTWYGGMPSGFRVAGATSETNADDLSCFIVDESTGVFSIVGSDHLPAGLYSISIACMVDGAEKMFRDIISVELMKPVPDGISVTPSELVVPVSDINVTGEGVELPTSVIAPDGENNLMIKAYSIANVYRNGVLLGDCSDWFSVSQDGVFSIAPDNADMVGGRYVFDFRLTTYMVGEDDDTGLFAGALSLNVTSSPQKVTYTPAASKVEKGYESVTSAPDYIGSPDGLRYEIERVAPDNAPGIGIDAATGVLTFPARQDLTTGVMYEVDLKLSNDYGSTSFKKAYTFEVIDYISPITAFEYNDISENISGVSFVNPVVKMDGTEVTYSFVNLPEALSALTIDTVTGTVSNPVGSALPVGDYSVTVRASNAKGYKDAVFGLHVIANPNYFTYAIWGNNLGPDGSALTPLEKYGNQFRQSGTKTLNFPLLDSDIPEGRPVKYSFSRPSTSFSGIGFNDKTATIQIYTKTAPAVTFGIITITVGEGEAAVSRKFPVFADFCYPTAAGKNAAGYRISYTPFAFRVNPKTGGRSVSPVILDPDGNNVSDKVSLDYRTNPFFWNINGPSSHSEDKKLGNAPNTCFLRFPWAKYYYAINQVPNYGAMNPVSYYLNYNRGRLPYSPCYVDASTLQVVVNPEKFVDNDGVYADGCVYMTFNFYGRAANFDCQNGNAQCDQQNRLLIWLDPSYNE